MSDEAKALRLLMQRLELTERQWQAEREAHGTTARALMQAMGDIGRITAEADALYRQRDEARAEVERPQGELGAQDADIIVMKAKHRAALESLRERCAEAVTVAGHEAFAARIRAVPLEVEP